MGASWSRAPTGRDGKSLASLTRALLTAVLVIDSDAEKGEREIVSMQGEMPLPIDPPTGCHFHPRCRQVISACRGAYWMFVILVRVIRQDVFSMPRK